MVKSTSSSLQGDHRRAQAESEEPRSPVGALEDDDEEEEEEKRSADDEAPVLSWDDRCPSSTKTW
jgi:hypothetical protein